MSQTDASGNARSGRGNSFAPKQPGKRRVDWAILVVVLAIGCTLGWISLLLWGAVRVFQIALL